MSARFLVNPGAPLSGSLRVPGDKSISHRAVILGGLATGTTAVEGFLESADCLATVGAMRQLGAGISKTGDGRLLIKGCSGRLARPDEALDLGNAGTGIRLLAGLLAAQDFSSVLTGDASLRARPMRRVIEPLEMMGATILSTAGKPPLKIRGRAPLRAIDYVLPVASAQVQSCLLLAGLFAEGETRITEPAPLRDHTERMLAAMGVAIKRDGATTMIRGGQSLRGIKIRVPADFSSAAFFIAMAAAVPGAKVFLPDVGVNPTRTGMLDILATMGADIRLSKQRDVGGETVADITVRGRRLQGIDVPPSLVARSIDEFPVLFVAAALAKGRTTVSGAAELRVEESDRLATMANGLRALGADLEERPDGMIIHGGVGLRGGEVNSAGDHRVAMALSLAGMVASGPVTVADVDNVATSYPEFARHAKMLGLDIELNSSIPAATVEQSTDKIPVIAVDGPSGSGKGTISRLLAEALGWHLLDSGALYRLTALAALDAGVDPGDEQAVARLARDLDVQFETDQGGQERILLAGSDVTRRVRSERCGAAASRVAPLAAVRAALSDLQLSFRRAPGLVADGRDMGTIVFPDAGLKIFLTASPQERAERRYKQLKEKGLGVSLAALREEIAGRDARDQSREIAPLVPAEDAMIVDTTGVGIDEVFESVLAEARNRFKLASG